MKTDNSCDFFNIINIQENLVNFSFTGKTMHSDLYIKKCE